MSRDEFDGWHRHLQTPVLFSGDELHTVNTSTIREVDLNHIQATPHAVRNRERVLILTPLRDAAPYLVHYIDLLSNLTYPHELIDLAFLVGDSIDDTLVILASELNRIQQSSVLHLPFHSATVVEKDFGSADYSQDVESRHSFAVQGPRRKLMGKARNFLLSATLRPEHAWVYWRDVDLVEHPPSIIEDFVAHDKDILVPSEVFIRSCRLHVLTLCRCVVSSIQLARHRHGRPI